MSVCVCVCVPTCVHGGVFELVCLCVCVYVCACVHGGVFVCVCVCVVWYVLCLIQFKLCMVLSARERDFRHAQQAFQDLLVCTQGEIRVIDPFPGSANTNKQTKEFSFSSCLGHC